MAEIPGCTTCGVKPTPLDPSARARSPLASTSTASTRLPARAASSAHAALAVPFPVAPLPAPPRSTASTRFLHPSASSATAAVTVPFPVPPLPATKTTRRCRSSSTTRAVDGARLGVGGDSLEHLGGVTGCLHRTPLAFHTAIGSDQERASLDPHVGAAHEFFLAPDAERFDEDSLRVADQRYSQRALAGESVVALR